MIGSLIVAEGEIVALEAGEENCVANGPCGVTVGGRAVRLATKDEPPRVAVLCFGQQAATAQKGGWLQARWHETGDMTVREFISYNEVWEVNPYEVGARRPVSRRDFAAYSKVVARVLLLRDLIARPVIALSNGEMRRVLLARAILKKPDVLVLDDPAAGLDAVQRERLKGIASALAARGVAIVMTYRHADEVPGGTGLGARVSNPEPRTPKPETRNPSPEHRSPIPEPRIVIQIKNLHLAFGSRVLFDGFSWTVREGERWVLRGENGRGKTTLLSLISGDNPIAYSVDIEVFGVPRKVGERLASVRERIGMVSPEMQAYLGADPLRLVRDALRRRPRLLLLDEPFMNMDAAAAREAGEMISRYMAAHPRASAIMICHREDEVPAVFDREMRI